MPSSGAGSANREHAWRIGAACLALVIQMPSTAHASYEWSHPVDVESGTYGTIAKQIEPNTSDDRLHVVLRRLAGTGVNRAIGVYADVAYDSLLVPAAWGSQFQFTPTPYVDAQDDVRNGATDFHFVVDEDDSIHVVYEAHLVGGSNSIRIGYKTNRDASLWSADSLSLPVILTADSTQGTSPRMAFSSVSGQGSRLHAIWSANADPDEMRYREHDVADTSTEWSERSVVSTVLLPKLAVGVSIVVDREGEVHFFGKYKRENPAGPDTIRVVHTMGTPPTAPPYTWDIADSTNADVIDTYLQRDELVVEEDAGPSADRWPVAAQGDLIHFAWNRLHGSAHDSSSIGFITLNTSSDTWSEPFPSVGEGWAGTTFGPVDSTRATFPVLSVSSDSTIHLMWHETKPAAPPV